MIASVNPFTPKLTRSKLKVVTMVTKPKSAGVSSRASIMVDAIWIATPRPLEKMVAPAPRTANRRIAFSGGRNAPMASKGFKWCP
jgi:hypothetical protein